MNDPRPLGARRRFLHHAAALTLAGALPPAWAAAGGERRLALHHTHTGERLDLVYADALGPRPEAMAALDHFLRDHYSGEVGAIDPGVFEQLHRLQRLVGRGRVFEVISGFRGAATNERLRGAGGGVARRSLHLQGRAIDVRLTGVPLATLRDAALALRAGGVGYYARSRFVHLDTGRVRRW